jgi:hypothetical protein
MNHRHFSSEELLEHVTGGEPLVGLGGCEPCEAEASNLARFLAELKGKDAEFVATRDWDDLVVRGRIRQALSHEKPHSRSFLGGFSILRPAFISALVAVAALSVWSPLSRYEDTGSGGAAVGSAQRLGRLPAWTPLPDESEDEGLEMLAEWTPTEDELAIEGCRAACLSGLSSREEEDLFQAVASGMPSSKTNGARPL